MSTPAAALPACTPGHHTPAGTPRTEFGDNHDRDCLSVYQIEGDGDEEEAVIHICDWPAFKAAGDQHQRERGGKT